jgi:hypothetical protein
LRTMTVLPEQVSHWDKWHLGIEASRVWDTAYRLLISK